MSDTDTPTKETGGLRTPIVAVLGHVDHGKTTLLDKIRGSAVAEDEAGAITQHIGATEVPLDVVSEVAGSLVDPGEFDLPGLLFIDTPGHHSFSTLRARGGALADIAVLVVDVTDGVQPQTEEAIDILSRTETPFVVAANKVDTVPGWNPTPDAPIQESYEGQTDRVRSELDDGLYEIIGRLSDAGFAADLYWRVRDFQANVGVVPLSAETGEGVPDLLAVLIGLSQRYMREEMAVDTAGPGVGTVLEVTEEQGFGTTIDVIVYDGTVQQDDRIVVGGGEDPIVTDVRALLRPDPLAEIRTERGFGRVEAATAATGVKIAAPGLGDAMAGAPLRGVRDRPVDEVLDEVRAEIADIEVDTEEAGVVVKADTLGSLEAAAAALEEAEIPVMRAEVGDVAARDVSVASTVEQPEQRAILAFNVDVLEEAERRAGEEGVRIFEHDVIYRLVEAYEEFVEELEREQRDAVLENIHRPARFRILPDHVFRQSNPAVVGVEVLAGTLKRNVSVCRFEGAEPERVGRVEGIKDQGEDVEAARAGERVSVAIDGPTVGRQIEEGDELWVELPEKHATVLEAELDDELPDDEREALTRYLDKRRERDPFWGK